MCPWFTTTSTSFIIMPVRIDLSVAIALSPMSVKTQLDRLTVKWFETLQLPISVNWGRFFSGNILADLLESLLRMTLSLLQPTEIDHYFSSDDDPVFPTSPNSSSESLLNTTSSSSPLSSPRNLAGFGQRISDFVSSFSSVRQDHRSDFAQLFSDIATLCHCFPPGHALCC